MDKQQDDTISNAESIKPSSAEPSSLIGSEYTVEERDTIPEIERKVGVSWKDIYEANKDIIPDPNALHPGVHLKIPSHPNK